MELPNDIKILLIAFCLLAELFNHIKEEVCFQLKYFVVCFKYKLYGKFYFCS